MKCPACGSNLTRLLILNTPVDVCQDGCSGIWFDEGELRVVDEPTEDAGQELLDLIDNPRVRADLSQRRRCPVCPNSVLMRHFFSAKRAVTVDECPTCAGIWLDAGELRRIRDEYGSESERRKAALLAFQEVMVGPRMALRQQQLGEDLPYATFRSRIVASLLVTSYLILAYRTGGPGVMTRWVSGLLVPWLCVCFPDLLGGAISPAFGAVRKSPRSWVWFFGWLVLLLPLIQMAIVWVMTFSWYNWGGS
jgi:Zn-finger nucleic acid-binding protein